MVAVLPASVFTQETSCSRVQKKHHSPSPRRHELPNPTRPLLFLSEKDNAAADAAPKRPRGKEVTSRYLSSGKGVSFLPTSTSSSPSTSKGGSSTSSTSSSTSTSSSSAASSATSSGRRFASPLPTPRPSTPPTLFQTSKRSISVDRTRPAATSVAPRATSDVLSAARVLSTTTRSLSVSFQGVSFSYQTSKARPASPSPRRKPTPERQRTVAFPAAAPPARSSISKMESSRHFDNNHRWPAARIQQSNTLTRSLDCSLGRKDSILTAVRSLRQSMVLDEDARRASFDGNDLFASPGTDSLSSRRNSCSFDSTDLRPRGRAMPRKTKVPEKLLQENGSRLHRFLELATPSPSPGSRIVASSKLGPAKKSLMNALTSSAPSSHHGTVKPYSPSKLAATPSRGTASPQRLRNAPVMSSSMVAQPGNAPPMHTFSTDLKRGKNGETRFEDGHQLRLFHNGNLQWRWINARANDALFTQKLIVEKYLYNAWIASTQMHESVASKKLKLHIERQNLKLGSVLKGQMTYLEEWSLIDQGHSNSLSRAFEALKATIICLPVVDYAKADFQEVRNAVGSAVDVMQTIGTSVCSILSKVELRSSILSELAEVATQEQALMRQCRDLLSTAAAMHVKQCSLLGHLTQLRSRTSLIEL